MTLALIIGVLLVLFVAGVVGGEVRARRRARASRVAHVDSQRRRT